MTIGPDRDDDGRLLQFSGPGHSPKCSSCPCAVNGQPRARTLVPGFGARRGLMVIGEGPSTEEIEQHTPFVGPSGRTLNGVLTKYGIDRQLLWVSNALLCPRPYDEGDMHIALACCRPRLELEIKSVDPTAILALGRNAMVALELQTTNMGDARGTVQDSQLAFGVPIITSIHPAAILRGGAGEGTEGGGKQKMNMDAQMLFLEADIVKAHKIATGAIAGAWSDDIDVFVEPAVVQMPTFALPPAIPEEVLTAAVPDVTAPVVEVAEDAPDATEDPTELAAEFEKQNPDVMPVLMALYKRVRNPDVFIELVSAAMEHA